MREFREEGVVCEYGEFFFFLFLFSASLAFFLGGCMLAREWVADCAVSRIGSL
jgi:hypothetical protein